MFKFETQIQELKYKVLKEVSRFAFEDLLLENLTDIPKNIVPGRTPTMRCCVYKERAILSDRVKLAIGGDRNIDNIIEVIDSACDECPVGGYEVTAACRGCLAHRCAEDCPKDAIHFDEHQKAIIDKSKCIECGRCSKVCPYSAITNYKRPCENSCKIKAITMGEDKEALIDNEKCIACGACISQCPFGAIMDKSYLLNVIDFIRKSEGNRKYRLHAIIAPSAAGQFPGVSMGILFSAIKKAGFYDVSEVALGADMVAYKEAGELIEKGVLLSSCCPAFVKYVRSEFPKLASSISENLSPAAELAKRIKETDPDSKVVFIGPCTAKKEEFSPYGSEYLYVDSVLTFEELKALIDSRDIDMDSLEPDESFSEASYYGRVFARSGGLVEAVRQGLKELDQDFDLKAVSCNGIEECRNVLTRVMAGTLDVNFIEGMACVGGCVGGAGCITRSPANRVFVDRFGKESSKKTLKQP